MNESKNFYYLEKKLIERFLKNIVFVIILIIIFWFECLQLKNHPKLVKHYVEYFNRGLNITDFDVISTSHTKHTHTKSFCFLESNYIAICLKVYRFLESFKSSIAVQYLIHFMTDIKNLYIYIVKLSEGVVFLIF